MVVVISREALAEAASTVPVLLLYPEALPVQEDVDTLAGIGETVTVWAAASTLWLGSSTLVSLEYS